MLIGHTKILLVGILIFVNHLEAYSQSISCKELYSTVVTNSDYQDSTNCFGSSMLAKTEYYEYQNMGFVVAYIKSNDYDLSGKPYIFCGISSLTWSRFKTNGMTGSWGESFHEYIMDYTCKCY